MNARIFAAQRLHTLARGAAGGNAIAVWHDRVLQTGTVAELRALLPQAELVDFGTATITPGLIDAHIHLTEWAWARRKVDLSGARSIADCLRALASTPAGGGWLQGRGWNPHAWGGDYPHREQLDAVVADRPVLLQSHDMHAIWVNTRALALAGVTAATPDPQGGRIVHDAQGNPTGVLLETAAQLVVEKIPLPESEEMFDALRAAQAELHSFGITGVHSFPGVHLPEPDPLPTLTDMQARGALRLRILQHIAVEKLPAAIRLGLRSGLGGEWIRMGGIKLFTDGALGSRTAWMREPYESSVDCGVQVLARAEFAETVRTAAEHGVAVVVHAIGDAANAMAFQVLSQTPRVTGLPHRVEHVQCFPFDQAQLLKNGIVCSVQPCHLMTDWRAADQHWGMRSAATYAFRTLLDHGAVLAFGSDAPVEPVDPRLGLYAAVMRKDKDRLPEDGWHAEQRITLAEAFAGYTLGPALTAGTAGVQGVLQPGAYADFAVWRTDPLAQPAEDLLDLQVVATVVGGEVVYEI